MKPLLLSDWRAPILALDPCNDAVAWLATQESPEAAWATCQRGDWMLWLIGRTVAGKPWSKQRRPLVLVACACERLALPHVKKGEDRPRVAIETAEAWARGGRVTRKQVMDAADAADAAAYAAYADAAAAAAAAAYAAAAAADRASVLAQCADIVRKHYPTPPEIKPCV